MPFWAAKHVTYTKLFVHFPVVSFIRNVRHRQFVKQHSMSDCVESFGDADDVIQVHSRSSGHSVVVSIDAA